MKMAHEKNMFAPGTWPDHVQVFTKKGMYSGPSKRMESESESSGEQALDSEEGGAVDTWYQCDRCDQWKNMGDERELEPQAGFVCSFCEAP